MCTMGGFKTRILPARTKVLSSDTTEVTILDTASQINSGRISDTDSGSKMASSPATSETQTKPELTKKQSKALEKHRATHSTPWNKPSLSEIQLRDARKQSSSCLLWNRLPATKPDLKPMQTLTECRELLQKLEEEVNNISQIKSGSKKAVTEGRTKDPGGLECSKNLILHWAKELELNMVRREIKSTDEKTRRRHDPGKTDRTELEKHNEKLQQWAVELMNIKEANGVSDEELKQLLYPKRPYESRLGAMLPLLEFVAWSLISQDTEEAVSMLWLPSKQKAWRTGTGRPRYIPNSVWQWIQSASVSVHMDPSSSHSLLVVSSDRLQVQEAAVRSTALSDNNQHLAEWPCVLGDTIITAGRHYWEVEVSLNGSWRVGVMSELAPRKRKFTMSPKRGYWTLWKGSSLWACTEKPTKLEKAAVPQHIGVYVDVEEGQVSFYDVERRVHIYTFSDTFKHSLTPLFGCLDGDTVLRITPARVNLC